jgi:hypothetical protein
MPKKSKSNINLTDTEKIEALEKRIKTMEENMVSFGSQKKKKDPNRVKKAPSAYNLFMKKVSVDIRKENPGISAPEVMKIVGQMWREQKENLQ